MSHEITIKSIIRDWFSFLLEELCPSCYSVKKIVVSDFRGY